MSASNIRLYSGIAFVLLAGLCCLDLTNGTNSLPPSCPGAARGALCTSCPYNYTYGYDPSTYRCILCSAAMPGCVQCTTSTLCILCANAYYGPTPSGNGCAPCAPGCNKCGVAGAKGCDPISCKSGMANTNGNPSTCAACASGCSTCLTNGPGNCDLKPVASG